MLYLRKNLKGYRFSFKVKLIYSVTKLMEWAKSHQNQNNAQKQPPKNINHTGVFSAVAVVGCVY